MIEIARPNKSGLDYFPLDVDIFSDNKLKFVRARFDEKGELIAIKILCEVYRNGYYTEWNEDISLIFSDSAGKNITANLANDVVHELVKRGFFEKGIFDRFRLLTSKGVQRRFLAAVKDRKEVEIISDYWLIDLPENTKTTTFLIKGSGNGVNRAGNGVNRSGNDTNKTKVNKTKVNETKERAWLEGSAEGLTGDKKKPSQAKLEKQSFGEFQNVKLSEAEYAKLTERFDKTFADEKIDWLDFKIQNKAKKYVEYTDHYATILNWCKKDEQNKQNESAATEKYLQPDGANTGTTGNENKFPENENIFMKMLREEQARERGGST